MASRHTSVVAVDNEKIRKMSVANPAITDLSNEATKASQAEQNMSLMQSLKTYPKAVGWSALISTTIIMEGFDIVLIANLFAVPAFEKAFGTKLPDGTYEISADWQAGLTNGAYCGELIGLLLNGWIADRYGYRKTLIGALALVTCLIFNVFFVKSLPQLLAGLVVMGIPWGVFQTLTTTYAAEVCPVVLRPYLTTYVNLCWVIGQFLASGVLKGVAERADEWAYRIPYACQWIWPVPLMIGIFLAPESPWWLVRKERHEDAKHALRRLTSRNQPDFNPDETIAMMVHTNEMEKASSSGTSYLDCFKGVDLRRTEVCVMTWFAQSFCGSNFMSFSTYFFEQAGLDTSAAFTMSLIQYAIGAVGVFVAWFLMGRCGRRTLYCWGLAIQTCLLLLIGFLGLAPSDNSAVQWTIGAGLLAFTFVYDSTVGPVCYCLVSELSSTRLRQKTVVLARNAYNVGSIIGNVITPNMLNPSSWDWGAKSGFFWGATCFLAFVWTYFRLPEPKDRTFGELDMLFEQGVTARNFSKTAVDLSVHSKGAATHSTRSKDSETNSVKKEEDITKVESL